jgi:hypothetical protein
MIREPRMRKCSKILTVRFYDYYLAYLQPGSKAKHRIRGSIVGATARTTLSWPIVSPDSEDWAIKMTATIASSTNHEIQPVVLLTSLLYSLPPC